MFALKPLGVGNYVILQRGEIMLWCFDVYRFKRLIIQFEFSPTWSCVSLTQSITSSECKLFRFDKMAVDSFQNMLVDVTCYLKHI